MKHEIAGPNDPPSGISRIKTANVYPAIPIRDFDWVAWIDGEEDGHRGHGKTEQIAIEELHCLLSQYDAEKESARPEQPVKQEAEQVEIPPVDLFNELDEERGRKARIYADENFTDRKHLLAVIESGWIALACRERQLREALAPKLIDGQPTITITVAEHRRLTEQISLLGKQCREALEQRDEARAAPPPQASGKESKSE